LHQEIEEEALVEVFEQVVQTSYEAFDGATQRHFVLPPVSNRLYGNGVNMVWDETAMQTGSVAQTLPHHAPEHGPQPLLISVIVIPHFLQASRDTHLSGGYGDGCIEEIEVR
jgi:hypothetical protein